jgi:steroid delta-isomerase-like uncharacterized protein
MDDGWLTRYIEAWIPHPAAGGPDGKDALTQLLGVMSERVRYEDVPSAAVFDGHDGIAQMCAGAYQMSSDLTFEVTSRQTDGRLYAFETLGRGTNTGAVGPIPASGRSFVLRGISVGSVTPDGLVESRRDYWDMAGFLVQLGVVLAPG